MISILRPVEIDTRTQTQLRNLFTLLNAEMRQLPAQELYTPGYSCILAVFREGDRLIGMATMALYKVISGHKGMIEDVVVHPDHRGQGIGRKLMERLLEEAGALQLDQVLLFSGHHRTAAIAMYKSLGFKLKDSGLYILYP